ncbi:MAG: rod shape-determining protein RodA [Bacteroidetes bacterium]|uniref:Cell wall polymerase n=1 Tax=Candidatus Pullibacteroides excrementavium TaxID=2840905 RepID=A0A9D9H229_9BACT|nr:rod shape-determining protein RodA [Candidatus Pullibacteroides excrementavium]
MTGSVWKNMDKPLLLVYLLLVAAGWFNIYSVVYDPESMAGFSLATRYGKQLVFIGFAVLLAAFVMIADVRIFTQFAYLYYGICILLLLAVLVIGTEISGAKSWIKVGPLSIQPSEFAKVATCLAFAKYVSQPALNMKRSRTQLQASLWFLIPMVLILLQPDAGSVLVFLAFLLPLYREGMSGWVLVTGLVAAVLFVAALLVNRYVLLGGIALVAAFLIWRNKRTLKNVVLGVLLFAVCSFYILGVEYAFNRLSPHQQTRINVLLGKEQDIHGAGYNVNQSKIAIGSGGFWGKGYLQGTQTKFDFVPEQSTDFIFCTVGEEWGWVGCTVFLGGYLFLLLRIVKLAERQKSAYARVYGYGVAGIFFMHFFVNVGMTIGLLPVIGIPLPFFSYGGSSLWAFTLLLFIFVKMDARQRNL